MALLRLIADILFYLTLGLLVYWYLTEDITALFLAIASGVISFILFINTSDSKQSRHQRHRGVDSYDIWDWWFYVELLEIPFRIIIWLFSRLWRVFD